MVSSEEPEPDLPPPPFVTLCRELGWTIEHLAHEAGLHYRTVKNWTTRRRAPSGIQLTKLANALGVPLSALRDPHAPTSHVPTNPERRPWGASESPLGDALERFRNATS